MHAEVLRAKRFVADREDASGEKGVSSIEVAVDDAGVPHPAHLVMPEVQ